MNVLILGKGTGGSFQMRGVQLGAAIGARVTSAPTDQDWRWADVIVLVKRAYLDLAEKARQANRPIIWDALDFWRQPSENRLDEWQAKALMEQAIRRMRPAIVIGATEAQAGDAAGVCVPHHARIGLSAAPVRDRVSCVAYEGSERYLGRWRQRLEQQCQSRGWIFSVNPPRLSDADLVVAFRDGDWDGWMSRHWKSGVKIANALAAGRPLITQACAASDELGVIGSVIETEADLVAAFDKWSGQDRRGAAAAACAQLAPTVTLETVASRYRAVLQSACSRQEAVA